MAMDHNHEINCKAFLNLPQQRKINDSVSSYALSVMVLKVMFITYLL